MLTCHVQKSGGELVLRASNRTDGPGDTLAPHTLAQRRLVLIINNNYRISYDQLLFQTAVPAL